MSEHEMEERMFGFLKKALILGMIGVIAFGIGLFYSMNAQAAPKKGGSRVVYAKKQEIDFEGMAITGELKNPGEFYFQRKQEEKFDSLVKRRKNFQREMLRDVVMTK